MALQTYQYVDTSGGLRTVQASSSQEAISLAQNRAPTSGVMLQAGQPSATLSADSMQGPSAPNLPTPEAPGTRESYITSVTEEVANTRRNLEQTLKRQERDNERQMRETEREQKKILGQVETATQPFREDLENKERERLYVNENFEANQKLTNELETLLTEGNNLIRYQQGLPVSQRVVSARTAKAVEDVAARAGVIQAVMSARNNQISQAYNLIDRSVGAITADRNDQLSYYDTLLQLNSQKQLRLDTKAQRFAEEQVNLIKGDLERAEKTADYIKSLMISPESAQFIADAGVTLNDSVQEINRKMREQTKRQEVQDFTRELALEGYKAVPYAAPGAVEFEVGGKKLYFNPPPLKATSGRTQNPASGVMNGLLGVGLTEDEIRTIDEGVRAYGIAEVIQAEIDAGTDAETLRAILDAYNAPSNLYDLVAETEPEEEGWLSRWWNSMFGN